MKFPRQTTWYIKKWYKRRRALRIHFLSWNMLVHYYKSISVSNTVAILSSKIDCKSFNCNIRHNIIAGGPCIIFTKHAESMDCCNYPSNRCDVFWNYLLSFFSESYFSLLFLQILRAVLHYKLFYTFRRISQSFVNS